MKKINILLAASAVFASALFVSCGVKDYVNVTSIDYSYKFNVTGTVETTVTASGVNDDTAKDAVTITTSEKATITGLGETSWSEHKTSNLDNIDGLYQVSVNASSIVTRSRSYTVKGEARESYGGSDTKTYEDNFSFYLIDDVYYLARDGQLIALPEDAVSGNFDEDFELNFTVTKSNVGDFYDGIQNARYSYTETEDPVKYADTVTTKYSFKFTRADN